jgi:hypothetical protein
LRSQGPEKDVPKYWLFCTGSRLDRMFLASTPYSVSDREAFSQITIKDQTILTNIYVALP